MSKFKTVRRIVRVPCPDCYGTGLETGGKCHTCKGTKEVERVVNEVVDEGNEIKAT